MKVCVVGAGRWGRNHVRTLHEMGVLAGIIDNNDASLNALKEQYPAIQTFNTLSDEGALSFDAYTVAVPAEWHFDVAKTLLSAKKHVLVEKPITLESSETILLNKLAKENNVILTTGHLLLFHPAIQKIKEFIQNGKIGKLQYMYSNRLNLGTVRTQENSLWSFAPHDISIFQYFTEGQPESISSTGGAFLQPHIHDTTMTVIKYPQNISGHIFVSWLHPFKEHRLVVIGSKGMLVYEDSTQDKELLFYEKGIDWVNGEPIKRDDGEKIIDYPSAQPLKMEMEHFLACIEGKADNTLISGEKGLEVLKILEAAEASLHNQKPQEKSLTNSVVNVFVHSTSFVDQQAKVGDGSKIWNNSNIQKNAEVGESCILGQNVNIGPNVKIGNRCKIQNNVSVYEGVELEDYVFCGPSMVFTNIMNPRCKYPQADSKFYKKTLIKEGASIGANATIVCGITLGKNAFIGAGSVVIKDVPDYAMMVGNPARQIGWMSEGGLKLDFSSSNEAYCEKSNRYYQLTEGKVVDVTESKIKAK